MAAVPRQAEGTTGQAGDRAALTTALRTDDAIAFTALTRAAAVLCDCPIALFSTFNHGRPWFTLCLGIGESDAGMLDSFCLEAARLHKPLILPDATQDPRFADGASGTGLHFHAGLPLMLAPAPGRSEAITGALCVLAHEPRDFAQDQIIALQGLAATARSLIEARLSALHAQRMAEDLRATLALRDRLHRQFQQAERMANIGSWRLVLADNHVEWSEQVYVIHELAGGRDDALNSALSFYPPRDRQVVERMVRRAITSGESFDIEADLITARGNYRRVHVIGELELEAGQPVAVIGAVQDITERHLFEQTLKLKINTDDLTHVSNRRAFNDHMDQHIARVKQTHQSIALILIDIDHFKTVNDSFGHAAGDDVLRGTAQALRADWLQNTFAARFGGDEFVLLVTHAELLRDIEETAAQLLRSLIQVVPVHGAMVTVTATCGICFVQGAESDRRTMLKQADDALYAAKRQKRGTAMISGRPNLLILPAEAEPLA
jgi:diguanylate cyclase (GGDEF)-like protein